MTEAEDLRMGLLMPPLLRRVAIPALGASLLLIALRAALQPSSPPSPPRFRTADPAPDEGSAPSFQSSSGARLGGKGGLGPAWARGEQEPPADTKDMGGWVAAVYSPEQQSRLRVDETGSPLPAPAPLQQSVGQSVQGNVPPSVAVDESGTFKYVLLEMADGRRLVRGSARFHFHKENVKAAVEELAELGLPPPHVLGGGRLIVTPAIDSIQVYGYSKTYGRCEDCNNISAAMLREAYPGRRVTWSNDGY